MSWVVVEPRYHDVVVSTYGRGLWVMRDITRLEQRDSVPPGAAAFLYRPRVGIRHARSGSADFLYGLAAGPDSVVTFEVLDSAGTVIRTLHAEGRPGLNRASWDVRYEGPDQIALRAAAPYNPHVMEEPRFRGHETRPIVHWGIESPEHVGPLATPGRYSVRMTVDGKTLSEPFMVIEDPEITSSPADLRAATAMQIRIRDGMNRVVDMANRLEVMRHRIEELRSQHAGDASLFAALDTLNERMLDVELRLLTKTELNSDDKWYVESNRLYLQYVWLSAEAGTGGGDVQGGAEYAPTEATKAWLASLERRLGEASEAFETLIGQTVPAFNARMSGRLAAIEVPPAKR